MHPMQRLVEKSIWYYPHELCDNVTIGTALIT